MRINFGLTTAALLFTVFSQSWSIQAQKDCVSREVKYGLVCVCNATYCDFPGPLEMPSKGQFVHYWSNKDGDRFKKNVGSFKKDYTGAENRVTIDRSQTYQNIFGFGGALTDAAGINIASLSKSAQEFLLQSYYSPDGNQYSLTRVPMGASDFSTHPYSYDDVEYDETLEYFNLTTEDYIYKIPYLKRALEMNPDNVRLFTAPWGPPKWMKTNDAFNGNGSLKTEYYDLWAQYYIRFLKAYKEHGIDFWALTTGNEPLNGNIDDFPANCLRWNAETQRNWVANNLGPTLEASEFSDVELLIMDSSRWLLPSWADEVLSDSAARKYSSGVAVHWYDDILVTAERLDWTHERWPDTFLLYTEAGNGRLFSFNDTVALGSWEFGELYFADIIQVMNHWVTGWTDFNMALNPEGGPNWVEMFADSPVIVNATSDEFYKQPMFYAIGHFSKFVPQGSTRIALNVSYTYLDGTAFTRPDGATVVNLLNSNSIETTASIVDPDRGEAMFTLPPRSFNTIIWQ